jgi:hypothetical protein
MSDSRDNPAGRSAERWTGMARGTLLGIRLALITALVWISWCTARTFSALLSGPRTVVPPQIEVPEAWEDPMTAFDVQLSGGTWSFAGLPQSIAISPHEGDELVVHLVGPSRPAPAPHESDLLPLPESTVRLGWHRDDAGLLTAELVSVDATRAGLLTAWLQQGWTVRSPPGNGPAGPHLLRRRGVQPVYLWFHDTAEAGILTLLLVRPAPSAQTGQSP